MTKKFTARFFDGEHIKATDADVEILQTGLNITYDNDGVKTNLHWPRSSLQLMERLYHEKPALIGSKTLLGARLVIDNLEIYEAILTLIPRKHIKLSHVHHPWRRAWLLVVAFLVVLILPIWHFHTIALWIANIVPYSWEEKFWKNMVEPDFASYTECVDPKGKKALEILVKKLSTAAKIKHPVDVRVIDDSKMVNAESAPGFHIFIYSGLFKMGNPDAVTAVIAHELGHSVYHHVIAKYISTIGIAGLFNGIFGLSSHNVAFDFINLKYSRDYETQSDVFAINLLKKANISPKGFQLAIEYLKKISPDYEGIEPYLTDHPDNRDRLSLIKNTEDLPAPTPSLSPQEWEALQGICKKTRAMTFEK